MKRKSFVIFILCLMLGFLFFHLAQAKEEPALEVDSVPSVGNSVEGGRPNNALSDHDDNIGIGAFLIAFLFACVLMAFVWRV